jgi:CheY-like chemotaxis protein
VGKLEPTSLVGIHVLIVDDNDDSREVCARVLEHCGALVTAASSARQALSFSATIRPDVVVTDLSMPDDDGVWLVEQLRVLHDRLPVIALTGYADIFGDRLKAARFNRVLPKPVDPWQLAAAVAAVVE